MPLFDAAIFDPAIFDTYDTATSIIGSLVYFIEKRKRNTLWQPYVWRHGMWEKTLLREQVKQVEKTK